MLATLQPLHATELFIDSSTLSVSACGRQMLWLRVKNMNLLFKVLYCRLKTYLSLNSFHFWYLFYKWLYFCSVWFLSVLCFVSNSCNIFKWKKHAAGWEYLQIIKAVHVVIQSAANNLFISVLAFSC